MKTKRVTYTPEQREVITALRAMPYLHLRCSQTDHPNYHTFVELFKMGKVDKVYNKMYGEQVFALPRK